jgi:hypothetical protein
MRSDERYASRKLLEAANLARVLLREVLESGPPFPIGRQIPDVLNNLAEGIGLVEHEMRMTYHDVDAFYKGDTES